MLARPRVILRGFLLQPQDADGFQNAQGAHAVHVCRVFRALKAHRHMALRTQVVDFVGLGFLHDAHQIAGVGQVAVVQLEVGTCGVRVLVDVVNPLGVKRASPALDAVHDVAFFQ